MSFANGAPGTTVTEVNNSTYIAAASSTIGAMLGITERGVPDVPQLCKSWADFQAYYGGHLASSDVPLAAKMALDLGCWVYVVRATAHTANVTNAIAASVMLQTVGGGQSAGVELGTVAGVAWQGGPAWDFPNAAGIAYAIGLKIDGAAAVDAVINATPASVLLSNVATFALANGQTILYRLGPATAPVRTLTFAAADFVAIANATPTEVLKVLDRDLIGYPGVNVKLVGNQITIYTDQQGSGARLEFTGGTALAALGIAVAVNVGTGNVADADHVQVAELNAIIQAVAPGATFSATPANLPQITRNVLGAAASIQIDTTGSPARIAGAAVLGLDNALHAGASAVPVNTLKILAGQFGFADPGTWGNSLTVDIALATINPASRFKVTIKRAGVVVGTPQDEVSMDPSDARYIAKVYANDPYVIVQDQLAQATVGTFVAARPAVQVGTAFAGGIDGTAGIVDADYIGDSVAKTGLRGLDAIANVSFLGAPGYTSRNFEISAIAYCESRLDCFFVGDTPKGLTPSQVVDYRQATGAYVGGAAFNSTYGAIYDNFLLVTDPLTKLPRYISPMGGVFAAYANASTDGKKTPWAAPAGPQNGVIPGVLGVYSARDINADVGQIYSAGINPIINHPKFGVCIWGQKTLPAVPSDLDRVNVRRGFILLRVSLKDPINQIALFQPNDPISWRKTATKVEPFMKDQVAVRGITDWKFVNDATVNSASDITQHKMNPKLYVMPTLSTEFIEISLVDVAQGTDLQKTS